MSNGLPPLPKAASQRCQRRENGGYCMVPAYSADELKAFAHAAIAKALAEAQQPAERQPLTEEQIFEAFDADVDEIAAARADMESWGVIVTMVRAIEAVHGISAAGVKEPGNARVQPGTQAQPE